MCAKALAAHAARWPSAVPPASMAAMASGYWAGSVSTATPAWFLAAARIMAGPPMSMFSLISRGAAPESRVASNG